MFLFSLSLSPCFLYYLHFLILRYFFSKSLLIAVYTCVILSTSRVLCSSIIVFLIHLHISGKKGWNFGVKKRAISCSFSFFSICQLQQLIVCFENGFIFDELRKFFCFSFLIVGQRPKFHAQFHHRHSMKDGNEEMKDARYQKLFRIFLVSAWNWGQHKIQPKDGPMNG